MEVHRSVGTRVHELVEMANAVRDVTPTFDRYYHRYYGNESK